MALSKDKKAEVVSQIARLLDESKMTVFASYSGTSVKSMQKLRADSKASGTVIKVVKNRLFKQALSANDKYKDIDTSDLTGQLLYAFNGDDEVAPAQSLANFAKDEPQIKFVGGLMTDGKILTAEEVQTLAKLPSKSQLIAETVATLLSPLNDITGGLAGDLHAVLDGLAAKST